MVSYYSIFKDWNTKKCVFMFGKVGVSSRWKVMLDLEQKLINPRTLFEMALYSMLPRVILIEQQLGVKISAHHESEVYRRNKMRLMKLQFSLFRKEAKKDDLILE